MPPLTQRIKKASTLVRLAAALIAFLPSVAVLLGLVAIPPSIQDLTKYITTIVSLVVVIAVFLLEPPIAKMSNGIAVAVIGISAILGAAAATGYFNFARHHIIAVPDGSGAVLVFPVHPSAELQTLMKPYGHDYTEALATSIQRNRMMDLINEESSSAILIMISLMVAAQALSIGAIVMGAWKLSS